ncbi:hypothetical protein CPB86DRAFT_783972 [Serendipita vermifera]|nr:hypothetical protein CPB86DRAFT_783972 [Serendipita vermifera]
MFRILNRTLFFLCAASSFLSIPIHLSTSASSIGAASLQPLLFITLLAAIASPAHGYALPEKHVDMVPAIGKRNEDWSTPCESQDEATGTVASLGEPVTVTITVFVPPTSNSTATSTRPHATSTESPVETGTESGSSHGNSTSTSYGSGSVTTTPSTTRTTSTPSPSATVDPVLASAEQAQRLNVAFQSLKVTDACTGTAMYPIVKAMTNSLQRVNERASKTR